MKRTPQVTFTVAISALAATIAGCSGEIGALLTPHLFEISVLPSHDTDGAHRVEPGGRITVSVQIRMGRNVRAETGITVVPGQLPANVAISITMPTTGPLSAESTAIIAYTLNASAGALPGQYSITFTATGSVSPEVGDDVDDTETTSFILTIIGAAGECTSPPADIAGVWTGAYSCTSSCNPEGLGGPIVLTITQNGATASFTDSLGASFSGMVCGGALTFSSSDPAVVETGTFTVTSGGQATKQSHYRATESPFCEGDCADTLTRQ